MIAKDYSAIAYIPNTTRDRMTQLFQSKHALWTKPGFIAFFTISLGCMDGLVLYTLFDRAMTQAWFMGYLMSFGVSIFLNLIPIFTSRLVHRAIYNTHKHSLVFAAILITAFLILYGATVYLRFAYEDMYGDVEVISLTNALTSEDDEDLVVDDKKSVRSRAIVILLAIEPLATSICGFVLAFLSDDELEREYETLEIQITELENEIAYDKAGIETMIESEELTNMKLALDKQIFECEKSRILKKGDVAMALARDYLEMKLNDPAAISHLSFDMHIDDEISCSTKMYEYPTADSENENLYVVNEN